MPPQRVTVFPGVETESFPSQNPCESGFTILILKFKVSNDFQVAEITCCLRLQPSPSLSLGYTFYFLLPFTGFPELAENGNPWKGVTPTP